MGWITSGPVVKPTTPPSKGSERSVFLGVFFLLVLMHCYFVVCSYVCCCLFAFGFKSTITKLYFEPCYQLTFWSYVKRTGTVRLKALLTLTELKERESCLQGRRRTNGEKNTASISSSLSLYSISTHSSTTLCTYRHLN